MNAEHEQSVGGAANLNRDVLITRIVDGRAADAEWQALRAMASADQAIWGSLAEAQRQASLLTEAMAPAMAAADRSVLPAVGLRGEREAWGEGQSGWRLRAGLGWAVAAALGLVALNGWLNPSGSGSGGNTASLVPVPNMSADKLLSDYMTHGREQGRVVGELPERVVLESRPSPTGSGFEVLYLRQIIERATVQDLYRIGTTDSGHRVLLPSEQPTTDGGSL